MALQPRNRRDTPAQDREARRRESARRYELSAAGTRRDTPAQYDNLTRQNTRPQGMQTGRDRASRERERATAIGRRNDQGFVGRGLSALREMSRAQPGDAVGQQQYYGQQETGPDRAMPFLRNVGGFAQEVIDEQGGGLTGVRRLAMTRPEQLADASRWVGSQMDDMGILPGFMGGGQGPQDARGQNTPGRRDSAAPQINPTALGMARGVGGGQGYATGPDGRTTFYEGTQRNDGPGNLSVMGNMGAANQEFERANAIRQEMIDAQRVDPQNQVTVIGDDPQGGAGGVNRQIERLLRSASSTRDPWERAAINGQINQLQAVADRQVTQQDAALDRQNQMGVQQLRNQGAMATTLAGGRGAGTNPYDVARAQQVQQEMQQAQNPLQGDRPQIDMDTISAIDMLPEGVRDQAMSQYLNQFEQQTAQADLNDYLQVNQIDFRDAVESWQAGEIAQDTPLGEMMARVYGGAPTQETEDFSGGGLVPEFSAIGFAAGGMVPDQYAQQMGPGMDAGSAMGMGAPGAGGIDLMQVEYDQYAQGAQQMGVPAIPFEEFVGLKQQSIPQAPQAPGGGQPMTQAMQGSAMGFAQGGMIPGQDQSDTSGKMIVDPNPNAPQDSIPAVIDGNRPAKLDSGEFVIPKHVVMWHGIDKLNKLIAQAEEKGQGNGTESGAAAAGQSATGAAGRSPTA